MDVSLWKSGIFLSVIFGAFMVLFAGCGNRFDLATERGRRARIDEANFHLSRGECDSAIAAINPLYDSTHVDTEVRIIKASAHACKGGFNLLTLVGNTTGASNYFQALAKSAGNPAGSVLHHELYTAVDVLTESDAKLSASQRESSVNTYMVFLQLGVVGALMKNYGSPDASGNQGANLVYLANGVPDANEMSNTDACALSAAMAIASDSFSSSSLTDADSTAILGALNSACGGTCSTINKSRSACDGTGADPDSVNAATVVTGVNSAWP